MLCKMLEKAKYFPGLSLTKGYREPLREVHISGNPQEKSISPGAVSVVLKYMLNNICFSCYEMSPPTEEHQRAYGSLYQTSMMQSQSIFKISLLDLRLFKRTF